MSNYVVTGLTDYVEQSKDLIIKNVVFGKGTRERISIQTGVKYKEHIHPFEVDPVFGDGSDCGFSATGTATISERLITAPSIKVDMEICPRNLIGKYAEYLVRNNANENSLPYEQYLIDQVVDGINRKIDTMMWQGDTSSSDTTLKWIDGFLAIAGDESDVVDVTLLAANSAYENILLVYNAMTENTLEHGGEIYVSPAIFRAFMQDMVSANYYHYNPGNEELKEFPLPGSDVKVVRTYGLSGSTSILGTYPANLYYGCDMQNDSEDVAAWFSQDNRTFRLEVLWNSGVQIAFPGEVVLGTV